MQTLQTTNLIIGFGKAGKTLAADLAKHGQDVILVEASAQMYGGTCINIGCIPSKKLLVEGERRAACATEGADVFAAAMKAKNGLIPKLRAANFAKLDEMERVRVINARARFEDANTVIVTGAVGDAGEQGERAIRAERIFINTGSLPVVPKIPGVDGPRIHDSTGVLSLEAHPRRMVIVGGGYIGLEFAFMYRAFGTEVTVIDALDTFLPREDRDIADEMRRILEARGVKIVLGAKITHFEETKSAEGKDQTTVVTCCWPLAVAPIPTGCSWSVPGCAPTHAASSRPTTCAPPRTSGPWGTWRAARSSPTFRWMTTASCVTSCWAAASVAAPTVPSSRRPCSRSRRWVTSA